MTDLRADSNTPKPPVPAREQGVQERAGKGSYGAAGGYRPRLLDLFCGAGGCSVGYARAGFEVVGVDIEKHDDYPFELVEDDALDVLAHFVSGGLEGYGTFDVIHASPPCQRYSTITGANRESHPDLIGPVRDLLQVYSGLYVIENVEGARRHLCHPIKLCGSAFGLRVQRHRYFETNLNRLVFQPGCFHDSQGRPTGVYGDHPQNDHEYRRPDGTRRGAKATSIADAQDALGIDWMANWDDLTDAIPPAYTEWLGAHLLDALRRPEVVA